MAFGDRFKDFFGWGGDDDTAYEDDYWEPPTGTVDPWEVEEDPYGIGSLFDPAPNIFDEDWAETYDFGDWGGSPTVDFEDPSFDYSSFDVDDYLDSLLDPDYGGGTEGDFSDWFIDSGDPYDVGETYTQGSDEWDQIMAELSDYPTPTEYTVKKGVVGGGGSPYVDPSTFDTGIFSDLGYDPSTGSVNDWLQSVLPTTEVDLNEQERGIFGGTAGPKIRDFLFGPGGLRGRTGSTDKKGFGGLLGALTGLLGGGEQTGGGGLLGGGGLGNLATLWMLNQARKEGRDPGAIIPMGQQTYGMEDVYGGPTQDYRVFNIQPALMPGVAYANVGTDEPSIPPGMKGGGIASLEGSGDVTPAWLEPGEFVMTKKATGNIGAQNLYKIMKQAEGMN